MQVTNDKQPSVSHVKIDRDINRQLKIKTAHEGGTIQALVEYAILSTFPDVKKGGKNA